MDGICYIVGSRPPGEIVLAAGREALVIAADGGLRHLEDQGLRPDLIVGDFDSLGRAPQGDNVLRHPVEKDDTDMLLAVRMGLDRGYGTFVLYGGLGGRLDHTLANLQTLNNRLQNVSITLEVNHTLHSAILKNGRSHHQISVSSLYVRR